MGAIFDVNFVVTDIENRVLEDSQTRPNPDRIKWFFAEIYDKNCRANFEVSVDGSADTKEIQEALKIEHINPLEQVKELCREALRNWFRSNANKYGLPTNLIAEPVQQTRPE